MKHTRLVSILIGMTIIAILLNGLLHLFHATQHDPVQSAWQRAHTAGTYDFTADVEQITTPTASVMNIGRRVSRQHLFLAGHTDLHAEQMQLRLWSESGSLQQLTSGLEVQVDSGAVRVRQGDGAWEQVDNFTTGIAPEGDFLRFLQAIRDVTPASPQHRAGHTFARYTFTLDGPALAVMFRDQAQQYYHQRGELPPGVLLSVPQQMSEATGAGTLWINEAGLPARQELTITFPEDDNVRRTVRMDVEFADFGPPPVGSMLVRALADTSAISAFFRDVLLPLALVSLFVALLIFRHGPRVRAGVIIALCIIMVLGPTLFQLRMAQFGEARAAEAAARQQFRAAPETPQHPAAPTPQTAFDPHRSPLTAPTSGHPAAPALAAPTSTTDDGTDQDGDGLTDWQELRIGTFYSDTIDLDGDAVPDLFGSDTDSDGITDTLEVEGFSYAGQTWYTDPIDPDTNADGLVDLIEWGFDGNGSLFPIPRDTDGDQTPDLFDRDNDGDGVPDDLDTSPFSAPPTTYDGDTRFSFQLDNLAAAAPTLVTLQLRPTDPDHLWFARSILDWPDNDRRGQIQDGDGATLADYHPDEPLAAAHYGDTRLIPMLEVTLPGNDTNLPLLSTPRITLDLTALNQSGVQGEVVLEQRDADLYMQGDLTGNVSSLHLVDAESCTTLPSAALADAVHTLDTLTGTLPNTTLRDQAQRLLVASHNEQPVACAVVPHLVFDGTRMIDQDTLRDYGISIRDANEEGSEKLLYAPLQLQTDTATGEQVAFSGQLRYQPADGNWGTPHMMRLVWAVQTLVDRCASDGYRDGRCWEYAATNQPQFIHVYDDAWHLTGFAVREERGADLAIIYEDPAIDQTAAELANNDALSLLAHGLEANFLSRPSLTVADLEKRFDHETNDTYANKATAREESWGLEGPDGASPLDRLQVETSFYPSRDALLRDVGTGRNQQILEEVFGPYRDTVDPDLMALLLYARRERHRTVDLDALTAQAWQANQTRLTVDFAGLRISEFSAVNWVPFQDKGGGWAALDADAFWALLADRYPVEDLTYLPADQREGEQLLIQSFHLALLGGVTGFTQLAGETTTTTGVLQAPTDAEWLDNIGNLLTAYENLLPNIIEDLVPIANKGLNAVASTLNARALQSSGSELASGIRSRLPSLAGPEAAQTTTSVQQARLYRVTQATKTIAFLSLVSSLIMLGVPEIRNTVTSSQGGKIAVGTIASAALVYYNFAQPAWSVVQIARSAKHSTSVTSLASFFVLLNSSADEAATSAMQSYVKGVKSTAKVTVIFTLVVIAAQVGFFIDWATTGTVDPGSVQFTQGVAYLLASIILTVALMVISFIPIIGPIIVAIVGLIDLILWLADEKTLSDYATRGILAAIYSSDVMVSLQELNLRDTNLQLDDREKGFVVGNSLIYRATLDTTIEAEVPDASVWQARVYTYLWDRSALRGSAFTYDLSNHQDVFLESGGFGSMRGAWGNYKRVGMFGVTPLEQASFSTSLEQNIYLQQAGVNQSPAMHLNYGAALPVVECWTAYVPATVVVIPVPVCYRRHVEGSDSINFSGTAIIDVLPATLDDFYDMRPAGNGFRLGWDDQFAPLADADGDGLLSSVYGGIDPDDGQWDTDGDGLSDARELQLREQGIAVSPDVADADGDGLTDLQEVRAGTNPIRADSDNDQLDDADELAGWTVTVGGGSDETLAVVVTSNPLHPDEDNDGIRDRAERDLRASEHYYHPRLFDPSPLAIYPAIDAADGVLRPGQTFTYTTTVVNNEAAILNHQPALQVTLPDAVAGDVRTASLAFDAEQVAVNAQQLAIPADTTAQQATLTSTVRVRTAPLPPEEQLRLTARDIRDQVTGTFAQIGLGALDPGREGYLISSVGIDDSATYAPAGDVQLGGTGEAATGFRQTLADGAVLASDVACTDNGYCLVVAGRNAPSSGIGEPWVDGWLIDPTGAVVNEVDVAVSSFALVPSIATNGDEYMVVWSAESDRRIYGQRYNPFGQKIGSRIVLSDADTRPATPVDGNLSLPDPEARSYPPAIVWAGDRYVIAWERGAGGITVATWANGQITRQWGLGSWNDPVFASDTERHPTLAYNPLQQEVLLVYEVRDRSGSLFDSKLVVQEIGPGTLGGFLRTPGGRVLDVPEDTVTRAQVAYDPMNDGYLLSYIADTTGNDISGVRTYSNRLLILDAEGRIREQFNSTGPGAIPLAPANLADPRRQHDVACPSPAYLPMLDMPFEEAVRSTSFNDQSIYGNTGRCSGESCPTAGFFPRLEAQNNANSAFAAFFDGVDDQLIMDEPLPLDVFDRATISAWVRPASAAGRQVIMVHSDANSDRYLLWEINDGNYHLSFGIGGSARSFDAFTTNGEARADVGEWVHLTAVYADPDEPFADDRWRLYRNGREVTLQNNLATNQPRYIGGSIGAALNGSRPYHGALDDLRVYLGALSARRVQDLYNPGLAPACFLAASLGDHFEAPANFQERVSAYEIRLETDTDLGGLVENVAELAVTIDTETPAAALQGVQDGHFFGPDSGPAIMIGGIASDDVAVARVDVRLDGGDWQAADGTEAWTFQLPLEQLVEGEHTIEVRAVDTVGRQSAPTSPVTFMIDRTAPTVTVDLPADTSGSISLVPSQQADGQWFLPLQGSVQDLGIDGQPGSGVREVAVLLAGQGAVAGNNWQTAAVTQGRWSVNYIFPQFSDDGTSLFQPTGVYTVRLRAIDAVGNSSASDPVNAMNVMAQEAAPAQAAAVSTTPVIRIDASPPEAVLAEPVATTTGFTQTRTLSGTVSDPGAVQSAIQLLEVAFTPAAHAALLGDPALLTRLPLDQIPATGHVLNTAAPDAPARCTPPAATCPDSTPDGRTEGAASFSGSDTRLQVELTATPPLSRTIGLWLQTECPDCGILSLTDTIPTPDPGVQLFLDQGELCVQSDTRLCTSGVDVADTRWHHLVYTANEADGTRQLWLDGVLAAEDSAPAAIPGGPTLVLGHAPAAGTPSLAGFLDELHVFGRTLQPYEVDILRQTADRRWYQATLGEEHTQGTPWTLDIPANLEGLYQVEARPQDARGNRPANPQKLWRGEIDTRAPQLLLTPTYTHDGNDIWADYRCSVTDRNLDETSVQCPTSAERACTITNRGYAIDQWYQENLGPNTRLTSVQAACRRIVAAGTVPTLQACDIHGNCASVDGPPAAPDSLQAMLIAPETDTLLTTTDPVTISVAGGAPAADGLQRLEVLIDGTVVARKDVAAGTTGAQLAHTWQPADNQHSLVQARAIAQSGAQVTSDPVALRVRTASLVVSLDSSSVLTTAHLFAPLVLPLTGTVNAESRVSIQAGSQPGQPAAVIGEDWSVQWVLDTPLDGVQVPIALHATDDASRQTTLTETVLVDIVPPATVNAHLLASLPQQPQAALVAGQAIGPDVTQISLQWPASQDSSGIAGYGVQWSTNPVPDSASLQWIAPTEQRRLTFTLPPMQGRESWYAHLVIRDKLGNQQVQSFGPIIRTSEPAPLLSLTKAGSLAVDQDSNGRLSPGDTVEWVITLSNPGNAPIEDWQVQDVLAAETTLVPGSIQTTAGQVTAQAETVSVAGSTLAAGETVTIRFRARIPPDLSRAITSIRNQAIAQSRTYGTTGSDDTTTSLFGDATELAVFHVGPTPTATSTPAETATPTPTSTPTPGPASAEKELYLPLIVR
jgi:uncharacterized repeat protein (TIGR01451 family)